MTDFNPNTKNIIEVFITDIRSQPQAERIVKILENGFPGLKFNFDLDNSTAPFPCGHNILRAEGAAVNSKNIIAMVNRSGFMCDILADNVCV